MKGFKISLKMKFLSLILIFYILQGMKKSQRNSYEDFKSFHLGIVSFPVEDTENLGQSLIIDEIILPTEPSSPEFEPTESSQGSSFNDLLKKYNEIYSDKEDFNTENPVLVERSVDDDELYTTTIEPQMIHTPSNFIFPFSSHKEQVKELTVKEGMKLIKSRAYRDPEQMSEIMNILPPKEVLEFLFKNPDFVEIVKYSAKKFSEELYKIESPNPTFRNLHDKENFQAHVIEQIVHMSSEGGQDYTTIIPENEIFHHEKVKNPEIVEVLENVVFELDKSLKHEIPTSNPLVINMDVEQIDIIPKDHHRESFRSVETATTEKNDKFVGFKPTEDLVPAGEETTEPDRFFVKTESENESDIQTVVEQVEEEQAEEIAEIVVETLKIVGEYGRDLKTNEVEVESRSLGNIEDIDSSTTLRTLFDTFEEVVTAISDGIKLSKDVTRTIDSFRESNKEN